MIRVKVIPRASQDEIVGLAGDALKVRVRAAPVDNAANAAIITLLARTVGVPKSAVTIVRGDSSRTKDILLKNVTVEYAQCLIE